MLLAVAGAVSAEEVHSNYASADAARVGNGMYTFVLDALCILATDPTKVVRNMGQVALHSAGVKLQPVHPRLGKMLTITINDLFL